MYLREAHKCMNPYIQGALIEVVLANIVQGHNHLYLEVSPMLKVCSGTTPTNDPFEPD